MKAEDVAAWLEVNAQSLAEQGHQRLSEQPAKEAAAIRALIAERDALRADNERLRANWPKHHGCACKFDEDDTLVSMCQAHREIMADMRLKASVEALEAGRNEGKAERDALREALSGLLRHPGIADMAPRDKDPEDHALERAARAALERKP